MSNRAVVLAESIRQQILSALDSGIWHQGDRLPSTREMGSQLDVDPRLVTQAYRRLAAEGLIELRPRSGVYISDSTPPLPGAASGLSESWIVQVLTETVRRETPVPGLAEWIRRATETVRLRAFVVAHITDQVAGLERELRVFYGLETEGATTAALSQGELPVALRQADLVVTLESARAIAAEYARQCGARLVCVTVRPDIMGPALEGLMKSPTYVVVSDERFVRARDERLAFLGPAEQGSPGVVRRAGRPHGDS
jgi:DNA-binding transcriptional regulator YhcF (GntR family)